MSHRQAEAARASVGYTPPATPGSTGLNDAADPACRAELGDTPGTLGINDRASLVHSAGPQSFAPAVPGSEQLDPILVLRNRQIEESLLQAADRYYKAGDFRWFFAYAHGQITRLINEHWKKFQRPNALMRLNIHFAEEFVRAIGDQPHDSWKRAFRTCAALQTTSVDTMVLMGEVEFCGAAMANVHIHVDLAAAIRDVGCIPPEDYGNMLVFVNRGALAALVRLRGAGVGAAEAMINQLVAPLVKLEVKAWRNAVYVQGCNAVVPDPSLIIGF
jgi:hypothetical protein